MPVANLNLHVAVNLLCHQHNAEFFNQPALPHQGLEAQLLGIVVRKERPELEESKDKLVVSIAERKKKLVNLEDEILR